MPLPPEAGIVPLTDAVTAHRISGDGLLVDVVADEPHPEIAMKLRTIEQPVTRGK